MILLLFTVLLISSGMQFSCVMFGIARLPGDKFHNGILVGVTNVASRIFAGFLMQFLSDTWTFYFCCGLGAIGYAILLGMPSEGIHNYIAICLLVTCIGG